MAAQVFRLRTAVDLSSNSSSGSWSYHETLGSLEVALTAAHVDVLTQKRDAQSSEISRLARMWKRLRTSEEFPRVSRVVAVERHTDEGWVPVTYKVIAPEVQFFGLAGLFGSEQEEAHGGE